MRIGLSGSFAFAGYRRLSREAAKECSPWRKPVGARRKEAQPSGLKEGLSRTLIENPGPGVSTWTRAGCSNECANQRGEEPASGWARNTGEQITHPPVDAPAMGVGGAVRFDLEQRSCCLPCPS